MKRYTVTVEVDDNFELGWCDRCPLSYEESSYDGYDCWTNCVLESDSEHCPLEEVKG